MNEERIEVIKYSWDKNDEVHQFDIDWLIERAEKLEEVEKRFHSYENSLYEIKNANSLEDAQAIAFVVLNDDFE